MSDTSSQNSHIYAFWFGTCLLVLPSTAVVLGVAISWTAATQFSQRTLTISPDHFNAPYFSMWFGTNFMLLCYPAYLVYEMIRKRFNLSKMAGVNRDAFRVFRVYDEKIWSFKTIRNIFLYVTPFNLFWIAANYSFSRALMVIVASVATAISSCNAAMVYILSILLLKESLLYSKTAAVLFAMGGVVVMSFDLPSGGENQIAWLGIILSVTSAFSAAVYKVAFKKIIKQANLGQVSLFMTCLGFLNLTLNAIPTFILLITKVEHIDWNYVPWGYMCGGAALSLLFNFLLNFGVALLSPLVPSIGMLVGIPINTVCDVIFNHVDVTTLFIVGTVLIGVSFVLIILPLDGWNLNQIWVRNESQGIGKAKSYSYQSCM